MEIDAARQLTKEIRRQEEELKTLQATAQALSSSFVHNSLAQVQRLWRLRSLLSGFFNLL